MRLKSKAIFIILFLIAENIFSQSPVEIVFTNDFTGDTIWTVSNIKLELVKGEGSIWFSGGYLGLSSSTLITSFEEFNYHVDSIKLDVNNLCGSGFDLILYKYGETPVHIVPPLYQSIQTIINPWTENPDSLTMWSCEGGIKTEAVYYSFISGDFDYKQIDDLIIYPNPSSSFITIDDIANSAHINIYSINGDLVVSNHQIFNKSKIDISSLEMGMYILSIEVKNELQILKFFKSSR